MRVRAGNDLDDVAILNQRAQWHHAPIYAGARAGVAYFRVNHVREVNRGRATGKLNHFTHGCKSVNVLGIKIEF